jgi:phage terminase Nu1 subunit (DNA packaging protein)
MSTKPKSQSQTVGTDRLAKMLGITPRQVQRLASTGALPRGEGEGNWPLDDCVRAYIEHLRADKKDGKTGDYNEAKTREKSAKAKLAELQVAEREGKLLTVEHVCAVNGAVYTALVGRLCNLSDGLANICHNQPAEFIATRFNDAIRSALKEVAKMDFMPSDK